jgi:hypothetical protein
MEIQAPKILPRRMTQANPRIHTAFSSADFAAIVPEGSAKSNMAEVVQGGEWKTEEVC